MSRSIAACEGALLVVDATQGIQAQTIANLYSALEHDLEIIPVMNKIDMDSAMIDIVEDQIVDLLGCDPSDILKVSARTGEGVPAVLDAIVEKVPCPKGDPDAPLQALIFDSVFNSYRGIIAYFRVMNGTLRTNARHLRLRVQTLLEPGPGRVSQPGQMCSGKPHLRRGAGLHPLS